MDKITPKLLHSDGLKLINTDFANIQQQEECTPHDLYCFSMADCSYGVTSHHRRENGGLNRKLSGLKKVIFA